MNNNEEIKEELLKLFELIVEMDDEFCELRNFSSRVKEKDDYRNHVDKMHGRIKYLFICRRNILNLINNIYKKEEIAQHYYVLWEVDQVYARVDAIKETDSLDEAKEWHRSSPLRTYAEHKRRKTDETNG